MTRRTMPFAAAVLAAFATLCALAPAQAQASDSRAEKAQKYFTDTLLIDHNGAPVRFYTDMLAGKTVVISFFFTECSGACPLINSTLSTVAKELGDRLGRDIFFVSITADPDTDTQKVVASYQEAFNAGPGWTFLTGAPDQIKAVSKPLGQIFDREQHLTVLLVGNVDKARWRKVQANSPAPAIVQHILDIADARP